MQSCLQPDPIFRSTSEHDPVKAIPFRSLSSIPARDFPCPLSSASPELIVVVYILIDPVPVSAIIQNMLPMEDGMA